MDLKDYLINDDTNKIIVTDNCNNLLKIIRTFVFNKTNLYDLRVVDICDLAKESIIKQKIKDNDFAPLKSIDRNISVSFIEEVIKEINLDIIPKESYSEDTFNEVLRIINIFRNNKTTDYFDNCDDKKALYIKKIIELYEEKLIENGVFDEALLFNKAIKYAQKKDKIVYCFFFNELEDNKQEFLDKAYKDKVMLTYSSFLNNDVNFYKCYGVFNEIKRICDDIALRDICLGDVNIIYPSNDYENIIRAVLSGNGIDYNFLSGQNSLNDDYIQMLNCLLEFVKNNYSYAILKNLFENKSFYIKDVNLFFEYKKLIKRQIGFGIDRYFDDSFYEDVNDDFVFFIKELLSIFKKYEKKDVVLLSSLLEDIHHFLSKYSISSKSFIYIDRLIEDYSFLNYKDSYENIISKTEDLLKRIRIADREENNKINVLCLNNEVNVICRKYNYVVGLSESYFTSSNKESPLLNDEILEKYLTNSFNYLAKNKEFIHQLAFEKSFSYLENSEINYSYPYFDTLNNMNLSPCSLFIKISKDKEITCLNNYLNIIDDDICLNDDIAYKEKDEVVENEIIINISSSAIDELLKCPLKYYYHYDRKIIIDREKEFNKSIWLEPIDMGNFVHGIFEEYVNKAFIINKYETFDEKLYEEVFNNQLNNILKVCPFSSDGAYKKDIKKIKVKTISYLKNMHSEFGNSKWKVLACEYKLKPENNGFSISYKDINKTINVHLRGIIDRIDYYDEIDGRHYRIIDYKTGKKGSKKKEVESGHTFQYYLYEKALMTNNEKDFVEGTFDCFRYDFPLALRNYDKEYKPDVDKTNIFENTLRSYFVDKDYLSNIKENMCEYCDYKKCCFVKCFKVNEDE